MALLRFTTATLCLLALFALPAAARSAPVPQLTGVQAAGKSVTVRWSAAVRVHGEARARVAFDVRAGRPRVAVRAVRRGPRADTLRLTLARSAEVTSVRYLAARRTVRGTDGRAARGAAFAVEALVPKAPLEDPAPQRPAYETAPAAPVPAPAEPAAERPRPPTTGPTRPPTAASERPWASLDWPIGRWHAALMPFGERSFWLQPWRSYLDTVPGTTLRDAVGINFNVSATDAARTARLLADSGFRRARLEFGWNATAYDDPAALRDTWKFDTMLRALKDNGIRPLLLLNANHNEPNPIRRVPLTLTRSAPAGERTVQLASADVGAVVPGHTGFNAPDGKAADVLITAIAPDGTATLSKPLPRALAEGEHEGFTLRFAPFTAPLRDDGSAHPAFEATFNGWLQYVYAVTSRAKAVLGGDAFDVEIWNELSFGSDFLDIASYYDPVPPALQGRGDVHRTLLERTVWYLRDPHNGVSRVGVGDGFASESPWPSGATVPAGVTAIDKHPYPPLREYPQQVQRNTRGLGPGGAPTEHAPLPRAFLPEYYLNGFQTETLIRDLSPVTTDIYGTPHGRHTHPPGGAAPTMWLTELNLDLADERLPQEELTSAAKRHIMSKGLLRSLVAFVNKGVTALHFYAARGSVYGVVDEAFFAQSGDAGESVKAMARLTAPFADSQPVSVPRALTLDAIADRHHQVQFPGDGTADHPPLYNRDVTAVLPFQLSDTRFAIAAYVMTRDLATLHKPHAPRSDVTRWDLPEATYRLTLGGLDRDAHLSATDPLTGRPVPVTVVSRDDRQLVVELALTDSPRVILADESR